jgi:alpha-ketoglutarate-dependent taurine dioxygenase
MTKGAVRGPTMDIIATGQTLGARIEAIDLNNPLSDTDFRTLLRALGQYGVLCFPNQTFDTPAFAAFANRFGDLEVNVANLFHEPDFPQVMILSNQMRPDGKPVGLNDAGQGWHTDMSYSKEIALANVLHAQAVPMRNGKSVGETQFRNMHAAYDELPGELKRFPPRQADRGAEAQETSRLATIGAHPSPDRPQSAVRQPRLHDVDRRDGRTRERNDPGLSVSPSGTSGFPARPSLGGGRRPDVGQHRDSAQRRRRLHTGRASIHAPRPGNGHARLPSIGGLRCHQPSPASASLSLAAQAESV